MLHEAALQCLCVAANHLSVEPEYTPRPQTRCFDARACSLAAMGHKCPAHQRDRHPGYENAMRLFMMALQPAQTDHYVKTVLIPACPGATGAIVRPCGLELAVRSRCMRSDAELAHMGESSLPRFWRSLPFHKH